jgi:acetyltransferase
VAGPRLAIVGNASGPATMAADRAARRGVSSRPAGDCWQAMHAAVPARLAGPAVDLLGECQGRGLRSRRAALLPAAGYDGLLVLLTPQPQTDPLACAEALIPSLGERQPASPSSPAGWDRTWSPRSRQLAQAGMLQFTSPERCLDAFSYLAAYERHQAVLLQAPPPSAPVQPPSDVAGAQLMIEEALSHRRLRLTASEAKALLGVSHPRAAQSQRTLASDALVAAETLGLPVTLHVNTPDDFGVGTVPPSRSVRDAHLRAHGLPGARQQMAQDHPQLR